MHSNLGTALATIRLCVVIPERRITNLWLRSASLQLCELRMQSGQAEPSMTLVRAVLSLFAQATVGGTFTQSVMCAAPVTYCKQVMAEKDTVRAVLINAGQANAATGQQGWEDTLASAEAMGKVMGVDPKDIMLESTGVIGKRIKMVQTQTLMTKP